MSSGSRTLRSVAWRRVERILALVLLLAVAAAVTESVGAASELRVGIPRLPPRLDPAIAAAGPERMLFHLLFQGLVEFGERGDIQPALATQWEVSRDGLMWTFRLRPDGRFHNGVSLTPDIAVASLARHRAPLASDDPLARDPPAWATICRGPSALVREVRRGEPGTVQILLKTPFSPLLAVLAHPALAIVLTESDSEVPFIGTGPYRVRERTAGRVLLERAPSSHAEPPRTERIAFHEIADDAAGIGGLSPQGILDVYFPQAPPAWAGLGLQVLTAPTWQVGMLALRSDDGLLAQKAVRQAIAASLDPALLQPALGPWAVPRRTLVPPGVWAARDVASATHDPIRARRLLGENRVTSPTLTLLVPEARSGPEPARLADAIRISLAVSGVTVQVRAEAGDAYFRALRQGEAGLALHETPLEINDAHFTLKPLLASDVAVRGIATNVAFYRSLFVDNLLLRAGQLAFRPERLRLYHRLQAHVADELPYIPLYARLQWAMGRPTVRDLGLDPGGRHRLDLVWLPIPPASAPTSIPSPPAPPALPAPALPAAPPVGSPQ
ncbi:MAG: ABC transporter substrate-binding protein [Candidatus Rokuibacteriota bacterium]